MFYINLLKHQIKRLDRIIIQLFEKLGHYVRVFFLLFLVERSTRPARPFSENNIFGQTVSRNCFGVVKARSETRVDGTPVRLPLLPFSSYQQSPS